MLSNIGISFINELPRESLMLLVDQVSSVLSTILADNSNSNSLVAVLSLSLSSAEELSLANSLRCSPNLLKQIVSCLVALILKCGTLEKGQTLAVCGVKKLPAEAIMAAYHSNQAIIDLLLQPLLSASPIPEVSSVSHILSVDSCTSSQSRLCEPQVQLQLNTRTAKPRNSSNTNTTEDGQRENSSSQSHILLNFNEKELYQFYEKLEEIQAKLDSYQ